MDDDTELLRQDAGTAPGPDEPLELPERDCPECDGTCYDADGAPCFFCYGEGLIVSY